MRNNQVRSPSSEFQKGIRRDKNHYSILENEDDFENWKRRTVVMIFAHKLENVIDSEYRPYDPEDRELLADQSTFLYDVFVSTIRTPMGQHCVRQFERQRDARKVWVAYNNYMKTSTRAELTIKDILSFLTTEHFDANSGMKSHEFILKWIEKARLYDSLVEFLDLTLPIIQ